MFHFSRKIGNSSGVTNQPAQHSDQPPRFALMQPRPLGVCMNTEGPNRYCAPWSRTDSTTRCDPGNVRHHSDGRSAGSRASRLVSSETCGHKASPENPANNTSCFRISSRRSAASTKDMTTTCNLAMLILPVPISPDGTANSMDLGILPGPYISSAFCNQKSNLFRALSSLPLVRKRVGLTLPHFGLHY